MRLFKFELKKSWRRKKLSFLLLLMTIVVLGIFTRNYLMQETVVENAKQEWLPYLEKGLDLQREYRVKSKADPQNENFKRISENILEMNRALWDMQNVINAKNWTTYPQVEKEFLQAVVKHKELDGIYEIISDKQLKQRVQKNDILLKNHLPYEDENYSLTMPNFMKSAAELILSVGGLSIIIILMVDVLTDEYEQHTIQTLLTQPIRKFHILLSKYAIMMVSVICSLLAFFIVSMVIPLLCGAEKGSFSYPQLVVTNNHFAYITTGGYFLQLVVLFIGTCSFAFSLLLFVSLLLKTRMSTLIVSFMVLAAGVFLVNQSHFWNNLFNPFYYFQYTNIIELPDQLGDVWHSFILYFYTAVFLLIGYFVQKSDFSFYMKAGNTLPFDKGNTVSSANRFYALLLFELRKLVRQGVFKHISFLLIILSIGGYIFLSYQTHIVKQNHVAELMQNVEFGKKAVTHTTQLFEKELEQLKKKKSKEHTEESEGLNEGVKKSREYVKQEKKSLNRAENAQNAYLTKDWKKYYTYWIYKNRFEMGDIQLKYNGGFDRNLSLFTYKASIAQKEILAKKNLEPAIPTEYLYTIYDRSYFESSVEDIKHRSKVDSINNTSLFYLYKLYELKLYWIPLALLVVLFGTFFSNEKGKKKTLQLLETLPLKKSSIYFGKFSVSAISCFAITLAFLLLMIIIGMIGNRFGDWDYPILHYDLASSFSTEGGFHFINMGKYLVECSVLFFGVLLFLLSLSLFFSLFVRNSMTSFVITLFVTVGGYFISTNLKALAFISPFTYLNLAKIPNGELGALSNNYHIQTWNGFIVLVVSSIVLVFLGLIFYKRKNNLL